MGTAIASYTGDHFKKEIVTAIVIEVLLTAVWHGYAGDLKCKSRLVYQRFMCKVAACKSSCVTITKK